MAGNFYYLLVRRAFTLLLVVTTSLLNAQETAKFNWGISIGNSSSFYVNALDSDPNGNSFIAGRFSGTVNFSASFQLASVGNDGFIAKYSNSGALQWVIQLGSSSLEINAMDVDASGNIYVTGIFGSIVDFDPSAGTFSLDATSSYNCFFAKYSSSGALLFAKNIRATYQYDIQSDNSGNFFLLGHQSLDLDPGIATVSFYNSGVTNDIFLAKYSATGDFIFAKAILGNSQFTPVTQSGAQRTHDLTIDNSGNIYLAGSFGGVNGTADFDTGVGTLNFNVTGSSGRNDIYFMKLDAAGTFQWAKQIGGSDNENCSSVEVDNNGNVYIGGEYIGSSTDFDPSPSLSSIPTGTSGGSYAGFLAKYDPNGSFLFVVNLPATGSNRTCSIDDIGINSNGEIIISGYFAGIVDFDAGLGSFAPSTATGHSAYFIAKYLNSGSFVWSRYSNTGFIIENPCMISIDNLDKIYVTASIAKRTDSYQIPIDLDPGNGTTLATFDRGPIISQFSASSISASPISQPSSITFPGIGDTFMSVNYIAPSSPPDGYLVIRKDATTYNLHPSLGLPADGYSYSVGDEILGATVAYKGNLTSFTDTGLSPNTRYYYAVYAYNGTGSQTNYNEASALEANALTLNSISAPTSQPTSMIFSSIGENSIQVSFTKVGSPTGFLVVRNTLSSPTFVPAENTTYTTGSVVSGGVIAYMGTAATFTDTGLLVNSQYFYDVYAYNQNGVLIKYLTTSPLESSQFTLNVSPSNQPTSIIFSNKTTTSFSVSFTSATSNPSGYIVLRKVNSSPIETPIDGTVYSQGNSISTSVVAYVGSATNFNESGLQPGIQYYYDIFAYNGSGSTINYNTVSPLEGNFATFALEPTTQPTTFSITNRSATSYELSFTSAGGTASGYLIIEREGSLPTGIPVDGTIYSIGSAIGDGQVVYAGPNLSVSRSGLNASTAYGYAIFSYNGSGSSINYLTVTPLTGNGSTLAVEPAAQPTNIQFTSVTQTSLAVSFTAPIVAPSGYLILRKQGSAVTDAPSDGQDYSVGSTIGTSTVFFVGGATSIPDSGLVPGTQYHYAIFAFNNFASSFRNYLTTSPLTGSQTTIASLAAQPTAQPSISFANVTSVSFTISLGAASGNPSGYLILRKAGSSPADVPVDGNAYSVGSMLGTSSVIQSGPSLTINETGLTASTTYFYDVFSFNGSGTTINYLTTTPAEGSQTTLGTDIIPPSITIDRTVTSISTGTNLSVDVDVTDAGSGVSEVTLQYRTVNATSPAYTDLVMTKGTGNAWTQTIPSAAITELGVEYKIKMKDVAANEATSAVKRVAVTFPAAGAPIVYSSFGNTVANYRIVAIPIAVTNNSVSAVFDEFGGFDETQWRVFHYDKSRTPALQPLTASSLLELGKGYWLISNKQVSAINTGPGTSVSLTGDAFEITLNQGWNQIGNPFNFDISWTDIRTANPTLAAELGPTARTWTGSQVNIDEIKKSEGAYISFQGTAGAKLKIPATKNPNINGRLLRGPVVNALDQPHWEVMFRLENSKQAQEINGLGMHPESKDGVDQYDDYNMPRFFTYLEMVHPKRVADMVVAKDMVPTQTEYVWNFSIETSEKEPYTLRWENGYFGNNERQIWLVDETTGMSVNMRDKQEIKFSYLPQRKMKVVYGSLDFVSRTIASERISLWSAPNPVASKLSTTVVLPKADRVSLSLIDTKGTMTQLLYEGELKSGMHQLSFNMEEMSNGLYLLKLTTSAGIKFEKIIKQE